MLLTIDSSVLVAAFREDEPQHQVCRAFLEGVRNGTHTVAAPITVLVEVVAAIRRRTGSEVLARRVANELAQPEDLRFLPLTSLRARRATQLAGQLGLRGMDAIVVAVANELRCPLVSLDREMISGARGVVEVRDIEQL